MLSEVGSWVRGHTLKWGVVCREFIWGRGEEGPWPGQKKEHLQPRPWLTGCSGAGMGLPRIYRAGHRTKTEKVLGELGHTGHPTSPSCPASVAQGRDLYVSVHAGYLQGGD